MTQEELNTLLDSNKLGQSLESVDSTFIVGIKQLIYFNSDPDLSFDTDLIGDYLFCNQIMNSNG